MKNLIAKILTICVLILVAEETFGRTYDRGKTTISSNTNWTQYKAGDVVTIKGDLTIYKDCKLTVPDGVKIVVEGNVTINGTLSCGDSNIFYSHGDVSVGPDGKLGLNDGTAFIIDGDCNVTKRTGLFTTDRGEIDMGNSLFTVGGDFDFDGDITYDGSSAQLAVLGKFTDGTNSNHHPWGLDGDSADGLWFSPGFDLLAGNYIYDGGIIGLIGSILNVDGLAILKRQWENNGINADELDAYFGPGGKIEEILPIELVYFIAQQVDGNVEFVWQTASELNNDYFTIEYSFDAIEFEALATVAGAGTTTQVQDYQYTDFSAPASGTIYYRLKQTDYDGKYTYSDMVALILHKKQNLENSMDFVVYPNPTTDYITISGGDYQSVKFIGADGRVLKEEGAQNMHSVSNLPNGIVYVVVSTENGEVVKTLVKK